jgi:hypothetical protein
MLQEHGTANLPPYIELQHRYVDFFEDLMEVLDAPLLLQLEQGRLEGLTREAYAPGTWYS